MAEATVNGVSLVFEIAGAGDPVLLVCGTGQPAVTWQLSLAPALVGAGYQVITFDNRGMPPSETPTGPYSVAQMAADAAGLIEHLGVGPCRVAGYSLGAFITQELALARPDLVRAAAMIGTWGRQDRFRRALTESTVELLRTGVELPILYEATMQMQAVFSPATLCNDALVELFLAFATSEPWTGPGKLGQYEADLNYDERVTALSGITVPCQVVAFELDMATPVPLCREVASAIPGCRYVEIQGVAHGGVFERPEEVNGALIGFFGEA